jgi:hypothetical protein
MLRKKKGESESETSAAPNFGDFPVGSLKSRAAARWRAAALSRVKVGVNTEPHVSMEEWLKRNAWRFQDKGDSLD